MVRDGKRAFSGRVIFSIAGETGRRAVSARRTRRPGRYRARIVFPAGGQWSVSLRAGGRTIRLLRVDVNGAGPRISRPHGFELAEEHGDLSSRTWRNRLLRVSLQHTCEDTGRRRIRPPDVPELRPRKLPLRRGRGSDLALRARRLEDADRRKRDTRARGRRRARNLGAARWTRRFRLRCCREPLHLGVRQRRPGRDARRTDRHARRDRPRGLLRRRRPGAARRLWSPARLDASRTGPPTVADSQRGNPAHRRRHARIVTTIARGFSAPVGVDATPDGSIYVVDARLDHVVRIALDGSRTQLGRALQPPSSVVVGPRRQVRLYVSEFDGRRISWIDSRTGRVSALVSFDDDVAHDLVVQRLVLLVPERPEVVQHDRQDEERRDEDDRASAERAAVAGSIRRPSPFTAMRAATASQLE